MLRPMTAPGGRSLQLPDGRPFFWLADTAWEIFHRLTKEEVLDYLDVRQEQGFNVIQAVGLAELDGLRVPNREGHLPLVDEDPTRLNEAYWEDVEWVMDHAAERGIYTALLPTWGDKVTQMWGAGPVVFDRDKARTFGRLVAERFRRMDSVIWVLGGDRPAQENTEVWRAMAAGLIEGDGGKTRLMTWHPIGESSSSAVFHQDEWLDFNMLQTSHGRHEVRPDSFIDHDRELKPPKPVLDGEPRYENHPVFTDRTLPYFNANDVRRAMHLSVFAGGCGVTYGCHAMWQFAVKGEPTVNCPIGSWKDSLHLPGARQAGLLKKLMLDLKYQNMSPDFEIMGDGSRDIRTLKSHDGSLAAAYVPPGAQPPLTLRLEGAWEGEWHNPRTGERTSIGRIEREATQPSWAAADADWVLILRRKSS